MAVGIRRKRKKVKDPELAAAEKFERMITKFTEIYDRYLTATINNAQEEPGNSVEFVHSCEAATAAYAQLTTLLNITTRCMTPAGFVPRKHPLALLWSEQAVEAGKE